MCVIVQQITVTWTKRTRGAPAATLRNALPRALPLIPASDAYLYQRHTFDDFGGACTHRMLEECTLPRVPQNTRAIGHRVANGQLEVRAVWTADMGLPPRKSPSRYLLRPEQTARVVFNGRHVDSDGGQSYTRNFFNVAYNPEPTEDLFTRAPPDYLVNLEVDLF